MYMFQTGTKCHEALRARGGRSGSPILGVRARGAPVPGTVRRNPSDTLHCKYNGTSTSTMAISVALHTYALLEYWSAGVLN
jgi:hypothetical protein